MLSIFCLDEEQFEEIFEKARKLIPSVYPEWTDFNEHDPGITFLQLFSWLKETQQYHMDQIGIANYLNYLKLLGITPRKRIPSQGLVQIEVKEKDKTVVLPKNTQMIAGEVCFETKDTWFIETAQLIKGMFQQEKTEASTFYNVHHASNKIQFLPFGEHPKIGDCFYLGFDKALTCNVKHHIYFEVWKEYEVVRNPIKEEFIPLAKLKLEYYTQEGWLETEIIEDTTYSFLQSGILSFCLEIPMSIEIEQDSLYYIRFVLQKMEYEIPPVLERINIQMIPVIQQESLVEYEDYTILSEKKEKDNFLFLYGTTRLSIKGKSDFYIKTEKGFQKLDTEIKRYYKKRDGICIFLLSLSISFKNQTSFVIRRVSYEREIESKIEYQEDGFPYYKIELEDANLFYNNLEIMVEDTMEKGIFQQWKKVESFDVSTPEDYHYKLEEDTGTLFFGDCERGRTPEGKIVIICYKRTLGNMGNVRRKAISKWKKEESLLVEESNIQRIYNIEDTIDGQERETIEDCFRRFQQECKRVERIVTYKDYEDAVRQVSGLMIRNVKAIPVTELKKRDGSLEECSVAIVVQPFSFEKQSVLNQGYYENIFCELEKKRMIGTKVQILSPEYIGFYLFCEIVVRADYIQAESILYQTIEEYFNKNVWDFGKTVSYSVIYGLLDTLDCVIEIYSLSIDAVGKGYSRNMNGDFKLPPYGLAYLKNVDYMITSR